MTTPFVYGKLAKGTEFTNREQEQEHLIQNFLSSVNTVLISPRRWGKSSLVKRSGEKISKSNPDTKIVFIDMFNIRSEEEFYKSLSKNILAAVSNRFEELMENSRKFFKQWVPHLTFSPGAQEEFSLGLNWMDVKKDPDEILNLAEVIAKEKNIKIVICIDEFQNLSYFENPLAFQKKLRSNWQKHQYTSYCLYGSKRHMLMDFFASPSMPFYKFGDLMLLEKIETKYWKDFIQKRFRSTGKKISKKQAEKLAMLVENHPYYVQQLAQLCWFRTDKEMLDDTIDKTLESLVLQLSLLFQNMIESLSSTQINFLKAIVDGKEKLSSKKVIDEYKLGTSANISRIKKALVHKEIIDERTKGNLEILDPIFAIWFREYYMK